MLDAKQEEQFQKIKLNTDLQNELEQECDSVGAINVNQDAAGIIAFEDYLKIFGLIISLRIRFNCKFDTISREQRLEYLEDASREKEFAEEVMSLKTKMKSTDDGVSLGVMGYVKIDQKVYEKTERTYREDPAKKL